MIWTTQTHELAVTTCQHSGIACPAVGRMLKALSQALLSARQTTQDDFEVIGESTLDGCSRQCRARFFASHDRIRVFCDVASAADRADLDRFANAILCPEGPAILVKTVADLPCAIGQAIPLDGCKASVASRPGAQTQRP